MTPEERMMIERLIAYVGDDDELLGANWHQNIRNHGGNPPKEPLAETGRRLREQVMELQGGVK